MTIETTTVAQEQTDAVTTPTPDLTDFLDAFNQGPDGVMQDRYQRDNARLDFLEGRVRLTFSLAACKVDDEGSLILRESKSGNSYLLRGQALTLDDAGKVTQRGEWVTVALPKSEIAKLTSEHKSNLARIFALGGRITSWFKPYEAEGEDSNGKPMKLQSYVSSGIKIG